MRIDKVSIAHEQPTSKKSQREAGLPDQPTDQLLPDNNTRVWMADEWMKWRMKCCQGKENVDR